MMGFADTEDPNTNQCKKNGQIIDSQLVPGAFWNIMDPFCSFLNIDPLSDETNIFKANMKRCCIGCNHKVYSCGGISSSSNIYSSDTGAPSYASNWPNTIQQGTTAAEMVVNISSDPIFKESESLQTKDVHGLDKINLKT